MRQGYWQKPATTRRHNIFSDFVSHTVDGNWAGWNDIGTCTTTCGTGHQVRNRYCDNPAPSKGGDGCVGEDTDTRSCNTQPCPGMTNLQTPPWNPVTMCTCISKLMANGAIGQTMGHAPTLVEEGQRTKQDPVTTPVHCMEV